MGYQVSCDRLCKERFILPSPHMPSFTHFYMLWDKVKVSNVHSVSPQMVFELSVINNNTNKECLDDFFFPDLSRPLRLLESKAYANKSGKGCYSQFEVCQEGLNG